MIGTLTFPAGTPLRLSPENRRSRSRTTGFESKMPFAGRNPCKSSFYAFTETATETVKPSSLYKVLRVKRSASPTEIKSAYRSLAKLYHPDAAAESSDGRDFIEIRNAYATLSDPAARALYDLSLSAGPGQQLFGYAAGNFSGFYPTRRWETDQCW